MADNHPPVQSDNGKSKEQLLQEIAALRRELSAQQRQYGDAVASLQRPASGGLRESDDAFLAAFNHVPLGMVVVDLNGGFLHVNGAYCQITGYDKQELLQPGFNFQKLTHPDDLESNVDQMRRLLAGEIQAFHIEKRYIKKDGSIIWVRVGASLRRDESGNPFQMIGSAEDITERKLAVQALGESRRQMSTLLSNLPGMVYRCKNDSQWTAEFVSDGCGALTGYEPDAFLGNARITFEEVIHPDDRSRVREEIQAALAERMPFEILYRILTAGRETRWFWDRGRGVFDLKGYLIAVEGFAADITERKIMEGKLAAREKFLSTILDTTADGFLIVDADGRLSEANKAYCRMSGYSREELDALRLNDIDAIDDPRQTAERIARILKNGSELFEITHRRKDGSLFEVEVSASCFEDNGPRFISFCRDISKRKKAERELRESELRFRTIFDYNPVGIGMIGLDFHMRHANPAFCRFLGYEYGELNGKHLREFTHPDSLESNLQQQTKLIRGQIDHFEMEKRFIRKDGKIVEGIIGATLVRDDAGNPAYTIGTVVETTERNRMEQEKDKLQAQLYQAQKMESVGRLAGGVAHDFNNKLGVILGNIELALDDLKDPSDPLRDYLLEIREAARHSGDLIRQLLAFARKQTIAPKVIDINATVQGMLKMLERLIGEDIHLAWLPGKETWQVKMDPSQIDQVLANLCVNARDAISGVGKITIETGNVSFDAEYCSSHRGFVPGQYAMIAVSDTGTGMSRETLEHIFEPFFTTKGMGKGTGLGLATVYGIVKQNLGFINVYSELDKGTIFRIYVPRHVGSASDGREKSDGDIRSGKDETILLVEDEPAILKVAQIMLKKLGYRVLPAGTTTEALRIAETHPEKIDLLITDVIMPQMNGRELATRLRMIHSGLKILYMSGYTANAIAHHGILDEAVNYIQKPFSIQAIAGKIREVLEQDN